MRLRVVMVVSMISFCSYASDVIKDQLYAFVGSAIRSTLSVGAGYAVGRLFGYEHAGACAGALAIVASKEYPHGISREIGYCAPIAFIGWYCYANMRKQVESYKNDLIQRQAKLDAMNNSCAQVAEQLQKLKQDAKRMVGQYCYDIIQIE